ncbi:AraC family transcriptional regulator [Paenibacillus endoradicis]|uniref:AraC family transcriptional regulator n=1 Tax=Paenibacillus endoradicis TaxID=2972487 RepID=UPI00215964C1|nr:AraC family transcriptional regulator [Paenibacillus endoradicis]MCR8657152.1 AraC family transcriptional regulator [Paenibacillus endoradicis]
MYFDDIRISKSLMFQEGYFLFEDHDTHIHDILEVGLIIEDGVAYQFGEKLITGNKGDVFVCRPFEPHWGVSVVGKKLPHKMLLFMPTLANLIPEGFKLLVPFYTEWLKSPLIPAESSQAQIIVENFDRAFSTIEGNTDIHQSIQFVCLLEILIQIYDYAKLHNNKNTISKDMNDIVYSVQYLLQNFKEDVDIESVINFTDYKKSKFFEKFQSFTGTTPHHFLLRIRIQYAMDCLTRFSEMSILNISEECGFQSLRTFNNQFKKYTGVTPSQYRTEHSTNNLVNKYL